MQAADLADQPVAGEHDPNADAEARAAAVDRLQMFGSRLDTLFREQVAEKSKLEERWLDDVRTYNGEYDEETLARIKEMGGSEAVINLARAKCGSAESRYAEMILPTDDRNWSITATPDPDLDEPAQDTNPAHGAVGEDGQPLSPAELVEKEMEAAARKASRMQTIMDDQLTEAGYNAEIRRAIHYQVVLGTGIIKGPVLRNRVQQRFAKAETGKWAMQRVEDLKPGARCVNPWDWFPDMRATTMDDCEFVFERHRMSSKAVRELSKLPGFNHDQIEAVLAQDGKGTLSGMIEQADSDAMKGLRARARYEMIEYSGPIDRDDLIAAGVRVPEGNLNVFQGSVWFCNGIVVKAVLNMLDSGELMYDVVQFERDDSSIFGFGVPHMMRHTSRTGNSAWRMILDNARLTVGPQVVTRRGKLVPVNGDRKLAPMKQWETTDANTPVNDAFAVFNITPNFEAMFKILEAVRMFSDEETGLPMIAQGQQSPGVTKTAQGMTLLMNSANSWLRRLVKSFDDDITKRFLKRLYHWNMQYGKDEEAKGDYCVVPLGSSALMLREQQAQQLMQLAALAATNPEFAKRTKWGELYQKLAQAMSLNSEGVIKTEQQVVKEDALAAKNPPQMPPELQIQMAEVEIEKAKLEMAQAQQEHDAKLSQFEMALAAATGQTDAQARSEEIAHKREQARMQHQASLADARARQYAAQAQREIALIRVAAEQQRSMSEMRSKLGLKAMDLDSNHQLFNAEANLRRTTGEGI